MPTANAYSSELTSALLTCRTQNQRWATTLSESEQEIDQLLTLLAELPTPDTYRSLTAPGTYTASLQRLKASMRQLRSEVVCAGAGCSQPTPVVPCPDLHFGLTSSANALITNASAEYNRVRDRCYAFLGELMGLNLI